MTRKERLAALERAGELLKQIGEDFSIRFRRADSLIPRDHFIVTVECPGTPFGIVASADLVGGRYCEDCHVAERADGASISAGVRGYALDAERAKALWAKSEEMVGERFA